MGCLLLEPRCVKLASEHIDTNMNTYRSQTFLNLEQGTGIGTTVAVTKFTIPVIGVPLLGIYRRNKQIIRGRPKLICGSRVSSFGVLSGIRHVSKLDLGAWHRNLDASLRVEVATQNNRVLRIEFSNVHENDGNNHQPPTTQWDFPNERPM